MKLASKSSLTLLKARKAVKGIRFPIPGFVGSWVPTEAAVEKGSKVAGLWDQCAHARWWEQVSWSPPLPSPGTGRPCLCPAWCKMPEEEKLALIGVPPEGLRVQVCCVIAKSLLAGTCVGAL